MARTAASPASSDPELDKFKVAAQLKVWRERLVELRSTPRSVQDKTRLE